MAEEEAQPPKRKIRPKRAPRGASGPMITLRVSAAEKERLLQEAGPDGVSAFIRKRLFKGAFRSRVALRRIAALYRVGRQLQGLAERRDLDQAEVAAVLAEVRAAILATAAIPHALDDEEPAA